MIHDLHTNHLHVVLHVVPLQRDYPSLHGQIPPAPDEPLDKQNIGSYWKRHHDLVAAGVDGWWPDEGDWLNEASRWERHRMYYEGPLSDTPNVRPWNLQRNGAPGMARYGGWIWSGDINSTWRDLRRTGEGRAEFVVESLAVSGARTLAASIRPRTGNTRASCMRAGFNSPRSARRSALTAEPGGCIARGAGTPAKPAPSKRSRHPIHPSCTTPRSNRSAGNISTCVIS